MNYIHSKVIQKKSFLLKHGEVCKVEGFITIGIFRVFHIENNGIEQILNFTKENYWITYIFIALWMKNHQNCLWRP